MVGHNYGLMVCGCCSGLLVADSVQQLTQKFKWKQSLLHGEGGCTRPGLQTLGVQLKLDLKLPVVVFGHPRGEGFTLDLGHLKVTNLA